MVAYFTIQIWPVMQKKVLHVLQYDAKNKIIIILSNNQFGNTVH